jgi:hypothetical protein
MSEQKFFEQLKNTLNPFDNSSVEDDIFKVLGQEEGPQGQGQQGPLGQVPPPPPPPPQQPGPQRPGSSQQQLLPAGTPDATQYAIEKLQADINALKMVSTGAAASNQVQGQGLQPGPGPMLQKKGLKNNNKNKQLKQIKQNGGADLYEYKYLKYKTKYENLLSKLN